MSDINYNQHHTYINYILEEYTKAFPNGNADAVRAKLSKASTDDLYRVANAISRFGVKDIIENYI